MANSNSFFDRLVHDFIKAKHINYSEECIRTLICIQPTILMTISSAFKISTIYATTEIKRLSAPS